MKSGLTIVEMAQQIERQSKLKQDYLLDTRRLQVEPFGSQLYLHTFDYHDDLSLIHISEPTRRS